MRLEDNDLLIRRLQKGDEQAYVDLVSLYGKRLYGYAFSLTRNQTTAEDILQNVFLKTWEQRKKLVIQTSLQSYLFKSIYNDFVNQYKKKQSTRILEEKYFQGLDKAVHIHTEKSLDKIINKITSEIENLPPKCQKVFILSKKEGLTNQEIATYLNISIKTVESQISKAFSILRKRLDRNSTIILMLVLTDSTFKIKS